MVYAVGGNLSLWPQMLSTVTLVKTQYLEDVGNGQLFEGAIAGVVAGLGDIYSQYLPADEYTALTQHIAGTLSGVGLLIELDPAAGVPRVVAPYKGTPAFEAGILAGDLIIKIDGQDTAGMTLDEAANRLRGPEGTTVLVTIARGQGSEQELKLTRAVIEIPSVEASTIEGEQTLGYLRINMFSQHTAQELGQALAGLQEAKIQGMLLDLRNNPGGDLDAAVKVAGYFLKPGQPVVHIVNTGTTQTLQAEGDPVDLPLVVLVDQGSASASEIVAGAIKDTQRGILVGQTTFGKGLVQTVFPIAGNAGVKLTTHRYLTPANKDIHGNGIAPDREVLQEPALTAQVLRNAPDLTADQQLQAAMALLEDMI